MKIFKMNIVDGDEFKNKFKLFSYELGMYLDAVDIKLIGGLWDYYPVVNKAHIHFALSNGKERVLSDNGDYVGGFDEPTITMSPDMESFIYVSHESYSENILRNIFMIMMDVFGGAVKLRVGDGDEKDS